MKLKKYYHAKNDIGYESLFKVKENSLIEASLSEKTTVKVKIMIYAQRFKDRPWTCIESGADDVKQLWGNDIEFVWIFDNRDKKSIIYSTDNRDEFFERYIDILI